MNRRGFISSLLALIPIPFLPKKAERELTYEDIGNAIEAWVKHDPDDAFELGWRPYDGSIVSKHNAELRFACTEDIAEAVYIPS